MKLQSNKYTFSIQRTKIKEGCWEVSDVTVLENGVAKGTFRYPYPSLQQICWFEFACGGKDLIINLTNYCGSLRIINDADFSEFKIIKLNPHLCPLWAKQVSPTLLLIGAMYWGDSETPLYLLNLETWELSKSITEGDIDFDSIDASYDEEYKELSLEYKSSNYKSVLVNTEIWKYSDATRIGI